MPLMSILPLACGTHIKSIQKYECLVRMHPVEVWETRRCRIATLGKAKSNQIKRVLLHDPFLQRVPYYFICLPHFGGMALARLQQIEGIESLWSPIDLHLRWCQITT